MKVSSSQIETFLRRPPPEIRAVLLHGNDFGQMAERSGILTRLHTNDPDDVFSVSKLDGEQIAGEPGLIADSAMAVAMFGDIRLVQVKGRGTDLLEACKLALQADLSGAFVIIEASETTARHAIVKLFDAAKNAASIGCYADSDADIASLVREIMRRDEIEIDAEAIRLITSKLGSDRIGSRMEIEKLALFAGQGGSLSADEVAVLLGDSATLAITDIAIAAADGSPETLKIAIKRAWHDETSAIAVLRGCQGYFRQLTMAAHEIESGKNIPAAIRNLRPPLHFKLQKSFGAQLRFWRGTIASDAVNKLQDAELTIKSGRIDENVICAQCLLGLCLRARSLRG